MRNRWSLGLKALKAVSMLALFTGITMTGAEVVNPDNGERETSPAISVKNCEDFVGDVVCKRKGYHYGGGRDFCYYSLCEAEAAGAFNCRPASPVCEPH